MALAQVQNGLIAPNSITVDKLSTGGAGIGVGYVREGSGGTFGTGGYAIWVAPNGNRIAQCWGTTAFNGSGIATITFPITFASTPNVTSSIYRGSTLTGYIMSTQIGSITTTGVAILGNYTTGGSVLPLSSNENAAWIATGSY